jgi:hypothetical protein
MPITIEVHQGGDRTALWMLVATIGLFFAACAQALVALRQAKAARQQAAAARKLIEVSFEQLYSSTLAADNSTMPILQINWADAVPGKIKTLILRNAGLGPAQHVFAARYGPHAPKAFEDSDEKIGVIGRNEQIEIERPVVDLQGPGVLLHYESAHGTVTEKLIKTKGDFLSIEHLRTDRPYAKKPESGADQNR